MLTSLEVMSETFPSLPDPLQVERAVVGAPARRDLSPNSCNEGRALPAELLGDANQPHRPPPMCSYVLPDTVNRKAVHFPAAAHRFNPGMDVKHQFGGANRRVQVVVHLPLVEVLVTLGHEGEIRTAQNASWARKQQSYAHKLQQKQVGT